MITYHTGWCIGRGVQMNKFTDKDNFLWSNGEKITRFRFFKQFENALSIFVAQWQGAQSIDEVR